MKNSLLSVCLFGILVAGLSQTVTDSPSLYPSIEPSIEPSVDPSIEPSLSPSNFPTLSPTELPSQVPSTAVPSETPSMSPSEKPSCSPSLAPSQSPSIAPSEKPSLIPSPMPTTTNPPSEIPTVIPSASPTISFAPSESPTISPTTSPSIEPTVEPTHMPTVAPSEAPSVSPTRAPTAYPTSMPSAVPSSQPSGSPTAAPSNPTSQPSGVPTNQPTSQPTNPTGQPTSQPSGDPTNQPTSQPTSPTSMPTSNPTTYLDGPGLQPEANQYWFYSDLRGLPHIIVYTLNGFLFVFSTVATFLYKSEEGMRFSRKVRIVTGVLSLMLTLMFDFTMLSGRFNFLLERQNTYQPLETEAGNFFWAGPKYFTATIATLKNYHCKVSTISTYNPYGENQEELYKRPATQHACTFFNYHFNADLVTEGEAKFSLSVGLIIWFGWQLFIMFIEYLLIMKDEAQIREEYAAAAAAGPEPNQGTMHKVKLALGGILDGIRNPVPTFNALVRACAAKFAKYIILLAIASQQALVLLPLTQLTGNDYCIDFYVPSSDRHAVCLYKYAVFAIPYFIYHLLGAIGATFVFHWGLNVMEEANSQANREDANRDKIFGMALSLAGAGGFVYCVFMMLCFGVYYLFGGIFVGIYYELAAIHFTNRIFVPQTLTIGLFMYNDILNFFFGPDAVRARALTPAAVSSKSNIEFTQVNPGAAMS